MAPGTYKTVKCGKQTYDGHDIYLAAQHAVNLGRLSHPETRGANKYPPRSTTMTARV